MKRILLLLACIPALALAQTSVQKGAGNVISNGPIVVGNANSITPSGTGVIRATEIPTISILPTAPLTGGGALTGNVTIGLPVGNVTESTSGVLTITGGTGAVVGSGTTIQVKKSSAVQDGYLSAIDWGTFNAKQPAGNYITGLTGDGTAAGPGSVALTLATVLSTPGSVGTATAAPVITFDAKGRATVTGTVTITPALGSITGLGTGVATFLATPSSANLLAAMTTKTGTGNLVFGSSPTLTTPTIAQIINVGTLTLPTSTDTIVARATDDTLTNKTMSGSSNTFTNIPNSALTNNSITIGTTNIALGGSSTTLSGMTNQTFVASTPPSAPASGYTEYADSSGRRSWIRASDGFRRTWDSTLTADRVYALPDASGTVLLDTSAQTITNKSISGSSNTLTNIPNSSLGNSTISIAGVSTALGGSVTQDQITGLSGTGIVKRTGTNALGIATPGTDYVTPTGSGGALSNVVYSISGTSGNITTTGMTMFNSDLSPNGPIGNVLPNFFNFISTYRGDLSAAIDIVGLGSSVGNGAGLTPPLSPSTDAPLPFFVTTLNTYLNRLGYYNLNGINDSVNGSTVFDAMNTAYPAAVAAGHPGKIVFIVEGMNDGGTANFNSGETYTGMINYLRTLITNIRAQGADPIICTSPHPYTTRATYSMPNGVNQSYPYFVASPVPDNQLWPTVANSAPNITWHGVSIPVAARYLLVNQAFRVVARDMGVGLIDVERYWFDAVATYGQNALFDAGEIVHPNNLGYQVSYQKAITDWVKSAFDARNFQVGSVTNSGLPFPMSLGSSSYPVTAIVPGFGLTGTKTTTGSGLISGMISVLDNTSGGAAGIGGAITFDGNSESGVVTTYAAIGGYKENSTLTDYAGALVMYSRVGGGNLTERARISSAGAFLIGTTTNGLSLAAGSLQVAGTSATTTSQNGTVVIGGGSAGVSVGIGGGKIITGSDITVGGVLAINGAGTSTFAGNIRGSKSSGSWVGSFTSTDATATAEIDLVNDNRTAVIGIGGSTNANTAIRNKIFFYGLGGATLATLDGTGALALTSSLTTGAPTSGSSGSWKLGAVVTSTGLAVSTTSGVRVNIGGTDYTLAVLTTNP